MNKVAWSHLPNAVHIDRILADLERNPQAWLATRDAAWVAARDAAWDAASLAAWDAARDAARVAAWDAIAALIAWDRAGSYLTLNPEQVKMLAYLGDNIAILMYPAVVAVHKDTAENI